VCISCTPVFDLLKCYKNLVYKSHPDFLDENLEQKMRHIQINIILMFQLNRAKGPIKCFNISLI